MGVGAPKEGGRGSGKKGLGNLRRKREEFGRITQNKFIFKQK